MSKKYPYLLMLILFVLASVVADNKILQEFGKLPFINDLLWSIGMLLFQMVSAPLQAGASDFWCRKKSLIIALFFTLFSIAILCLTDRFDSSWVIYFSVLFMNGALGNVVPLAWSALSDRSEKDLRFSLAFTTGAYAIAYMVLAFLSMKSVETLTQHSWFSFSSLIPLILLILSIIICMFWFSDLRDKKVLKKGEEKEIEYVHRMNLEFASLKAEVKSRCTRSGLLAWILWANSQYCILIMLTDFETKYAYTVIFMMLGYISGIIALGFLKKISDQKIIKTAYIITIAALILFFLVRPFVKNEVYSLSFAYFLYTFCNAFLSASMLSLFSKERTLDEQGKGFGLIISADSCGFLIALFAVLIFHSLDLTMKHMVMFSFISFIASWFPYKKYEKLRKNVIK